MVVVGKRGKKCFGDEAQPWGACLLVQAIFEDILVALLFIDRRDGSDATFFRVASLLEFVKLLRLLLTILDPDQMFKKSCRLLFLQ